MNEVQNSALNATPELSPQKYWAFISYSHRDKQWGQWLHRRLERYRIPSNLVGRVTPFGTVPKRLFPIFLDDAELPASADLGNSLRNELQSSRCLIVICSPPSARSRWVAEEIRIFKRMGREHRIMALIVEGEPNASDKPDLRAEECFPDALRFRLDRDGNLTNERVEPMAADLRYRRRLCHIAVLKIVAGILGLNFDELVHREWQIRRNRSIAATCSAFVVFFVAFWLILQANSAAARLGLMEANRIREKLNPFGRMPEEYSMSEREGFEKSEQFAIRAFRVAHMNLQFTWPTGTRINVAMAAYRVHRARAQRQWAQGNFRLAIQELASASLQASELVILYESREAPGDVGEENAIRQLEMDAEVALLRLMQYQGVTHVTVDGDTTRAFDGRLPPGIELDSPKITRARMYRYELLPDGKLKRPLLSSSLMESAAEPIGDDIPTPPPEPPAPAP